MCCNNRFGRGFFGIGIGSVPNCINPCGGVDAVYDRCGKCCRCCSRSTEHNHSDCNC